MKRALVAVAIAGMLAGSAAATEVTIVPNVSIGKVKLGMTLAQVKKALGPPQVVNKRTQVSGNRGYVEYGWNFSTFWVGFINTKGVLHAALIGADIVGERTKERIGVGTLLATLRARLRVKCNTWQTREIDPRRWYVDPGENVKWYCVLGPANAPTTIFGLRCVNQTSTGCTNWKVERVVVRTSF